MDRSEKKLVSQILTEKREWHDASKEKPTPNTQVVVRMVHPGIIWVENDEEILLAEDQKIATFVRTYDDPNQGSWAISPPYPLYDYSPCSNKDRLLDGVIVTHWAIPEEGEIEGYNTRFDQINLFKKLNLEVDEEHKEDVYRALLWGAAYIQKYCPGEPEAQHLATILYDLQYVLDTSKGIDLSDEEYEAKVEERKAEIEAAEKARQERVDQYVQEHEPEVKDGEESPIE